MNRMSAAALTGVALVLAASVAAPAVATPIYVNQIYTAAPGGYVGAGGNPVDLRLSTLYDLGAGPYILNATLSPDNTGFAVGATKAFTGLGFGGTSNGPPNAIIPVPSGGSGSSIPTNYVITVSSGGNTLVETITSETVISRGQSKPGVTGLNLQMDGTFNFYVLGSLVANGIIADTLSATDNQGTNNWSLNQVGSPSTVPVPGALILFGSVIAGASMMLRRRSISVGASTA
jgi:hypothetical protein